MENKSNDATPLRPEGERILNAPMVEMDLEKFIGQIRSESTWANSDHNSITIYKSDIMRMVLIGLHKGSVIKPHQTSSDISVQVLEGLIRFHTEEKSIDLSKGKMVALQPKIQHSVEALEESFFLLSFANG